ncbi:17059_t:CDS:2, partial [Racocetra persica]
PQSNKKNANNWEEKHIRKQVHIYQQISSSGTVYSGITNYRTNNYIASDKNEEPKEPSIHKSSHPIKC